MAVGRDAGAAGRRGRGAPRRDRGAPVPPSGARGKGAGESGGRRASLRPPPLSKWQEILTQGVFKESSVNSSQTVGI